MRDTSIFQKLFSNLGSTILIAGLGALGVGVLLVLAGAMIAGLVIAGIGVLIMFLLFRMSNLQSSQQSSQQSTALETSQLGLPQQGIVNNTVPPFVFINPAQEQNRPLVQCPKCNAAVTTNSNFCPNCGKQMRIVFNSEKGWTGKP